MESRQRVDVVFFDMGGVLLTPRDRAPLEPWCNRLGVTPGEIDAHVRNAIGGGWEADLAPSTILERLAEALKITAEDADSILLALHACETLDEDLIAYVEHAPNVVAGVISNNGPEVRRYWNQIHDLEARLAPIVISGEERISKPDRRIFDIAAARADTDPSRCVLIDDSSRNTEGAITAGMHAIHHRDTTTTLTALAAMHE